MASAKKKRWSFSAGERGRNRVRAFEHPVTGLLFLEYYEAEPGSSVARKKRVALGHRDRDAAKHKAEQVAAALRKHEVPRGAELTLRELFDNYEREVTPTKSKGVQKHDHRTRKLFEACWGPTTKVRDLDRRDWERFIQQ